MSGFYWWRVTEGGGFVMPELMSKSRVKSSDHRGISYRGGGDKKKKEGRGSNKTSTFAHNRLKTKRPEEWRHAIRRCECRRKQPKENRSILGVRWKADGWGAATGCHSLHRRGGGFRSKTLEANVVAWCARCLGGRDTWGCRQGAPLETRQQRRAENTRLPFDHFWCSTPPNKLTVA